MMENHYSGWLYLTRQQMLAITEDFFVHLFIDGQQGVYTGGYRN